MDAAATGLPMQDNLYSREIRFGVVMYGGVSLAIYINGVTNELYEMACATPKQSDDLSLPGTRWVYRKASWLLRDENLRARYLAYLADQKLPPEKRTVEDPFADMSALPPGQRTRFVVDSLSGTSAGGINGIFLAKALVSGQKFAPLKTLWVEEGDIGRLLNDKASYEGLEFARTGSPPQSLLNSDRMYVKLLDAFETMKKEDKGRIAPTAGGESQLVDELDLYVTTTDIRGAVVPLRLFDKVVYEQRYKQVYHFQYSVGGDNHFAESYVPFLAFAARCTSSFPFAFEPMSVSDAERLCNARQTVANVSFEPWKSFFTGLSVADTTGNGWRDRAFGDGGYLDNKPFSYVVEALSWRLGSVPMERKLIYIEPAPAHPETEQGSSTRKPDALENALAAMLTIPQDETIREDIEAVLVRNRRIERVERIVRQVEVDIEARDKDPFERIEFDENGEVFPWRSRDMRNMVDYYGVAFLPYRHLRLMTVTDDIADRLAVWWGVDRRSDQFYALRALARAWREENFYEYKKKGDPRSESVNAFLDDYDIKYRLRRTGFILRKVHQLRSLFHKAERPGEENTWSDVETHLMRRWEKFRSGRHMDSAVRFAALDRLADQLGEAIAELRRATWQLKPPNNPDRSECHDALIQTLRLILGQEPDPDLKALTTKSGKRVDLPSDLPPPSPLRTLQENVFANAQTLFKYTKGTEATTLQKALEADILALKKGYKPLVDKAADGQLPLPQALLGNPQLRPCKETDEGGPKVQIEIADVTLPGDVGALNTWEGTLVRQFLAEYFTRFDEYDQASFPLYYDTGTGEPSTVEVVRISPDDATSLIDERNSGRRKLAGTALMNFGAFLDEQWRRNDIMWGRLDGCERILATLFPAAGDTLIREALLAEAQGIIVREEMKPENYDELVDGFTKALADEKYKALEDDFNVLWNKLALTAGGQRRTQIGEALKDVLSDKGMLDYVRDHYQVEGKTDTKGMLRTGSRALTITGRILDQVEQARRGQRGLMVWITHVCRAAQSLLSLSIPGSFGQAVFRNWLMLLYVMEGLIFGVGMLFGWTSTRNIGVMALCMTGGLHLASAMIGDYIDRRLKPARWQGWTRSIKWTVRGLALAAVLLIFFGAMTVANSGLRGISCPAGHNVLGPVFDIFCRPKSGS
ncbi:patatin-like protein [Bradyrhizobium betae]|uniref:PNPLA domain-containing protein n=1 Tax=Bradyrhizobium betae TaxID=244734 RepID=A0A4Q1UM04_9BRAD|nr:patatin-like protein [Bradyrhizobium betae]RXT36598.1 hypothetical protein B5V03_33680 [Bradyrhizobium betae]